MLNEDIIEKIESTIGYTFKNKQLLSQAFTRSSYRNEHPEAADNEVPEFIGDPVLTLIVINALIDRLMKIDKSGLISCKNEGELTPLKNALIEQEYLCERMRKLHLQDYMLMSVGDRKQNIQNNDSVLEDLFESLVAAIYIDSGRNLSVTSEVVERLLDIDEFLSVNGDTTHISFKNDLQELCQKYGLELPEYRTEERESDFQTTCFIVDAWVTGIGVGHNIKTAEENAAENTIAKVRRFLERASIVAPAFAIGAEQAINKLQEYCQQRKLPLPEYETIDDDFHSPTNTHIFTVVCRFGGEIAYGTGKSIKEAKKQSAFNMLDNLGLLIF